MGWLERPGWPAVPWPTTPPTPNLAVGGYTTTAVLSSLIGAATTVWQVGVLRAGAWAARGLRVPARNALLADIVPATVYGRALGSSGPWTTSAPSPARCSPWSWSAWSALVPPLPCRSSLACWLPWPSSMPSVTPPAPSGVSGNRCGCGFGRSWLGGWLMVGVSAFEFGNVAATLLILRATELLAPGRSQDRATQLALGLYVAYNLAATVASIPAGRLGDRRGAVLVLLLGVGLFGLAYVGFAAGGGSVLALAPWFVAAGVAIVCGDGRARRCGRPRARRAARIGVRPASGGAELR